MPRAMERPFLSVGDDEADDVATVVDVEGRGRREVEDVELVTAVDELWLSLVTGSPASGTVYLDSVLVKTNQTII